MVITLIFRMFIALHSCLVLSVFIGSLWASTECFWALGKVTCSIDQAKVANTMIEIWDKDGPKTKKVLTNKFYGIIDSLDHDDKAGVTIVDDESGHFRVDGCASDQDWIIHRNAPEFYFRIRHRCTDHGSEKTFDILPPVKVFAPNTYDKYMDEPIELYNRGN